METFYLTLMFVMLVAALDVYQADLSKLDGKAYAAMLALKIVGAVALSWLAATNLVSALNVFR